MRETYCGKCQGMVNGNGCDAKDCEVNEGEAYYRKQYEENKKTEKASVDTNQNDH